MIQTDKKKKKRTQIPKAFHFLLNAFVVVAGTGLILKAESSGNQITWVHFEK